MGALPRAAQRRVRGDAGAGDAHGRLHVGPRVLHGALASGGTPAWAAAVRRATVGVRGHGATHDACCRGARGPGRSARPGGQLSAQCYRRSVQADGAAQLGSTTTVCPPSATTLIHRHSAGASSLGPSDGSPRRAAGSAKSGRFSTPLLSWQLRYNLGWLSDRSSWVDLPRLPAARPGARRAHACAACAFGRTAAESGPQVRTPIQVLGDSRFCQRKLVFPNQ